MCVTHIYSALLRKFNLKNKFIQKSMLKIFKHTFSK
nr:MAG TPA: hypothetical protein [Caudoviricetes sp.]